MVLAKVSPSYLKSSSLGSEKVAARIIGARYVESMWQNKDGSPKEMLEILIQLAEDEFLWSPNQRSLRQLSKMFASADTDNWLNKPFHLHTEEVVTAKGSIESIEVSQ